MRKILEYNQINKKIYLVLSGIFLALAYLAHWDALFFDIAVGVIAVKSVLRDRTALKDFLIFLLIPFVCFKVWCWEFKHG